MRTGEPREKPTAHDENQQQTQPTNETNLESKPGHIGERQALSPLHHCCSPNLFFLETFIGQENTLSNFHKYYGMTPVNLIYSWKNGIDNVPLGGQVTRYTPVLQCLRQVRHLVEPAKIITLWSIFKYSLRYPRRHPSNKDKVKENH